MKRPLTAALLSALVFPGAGQLYLRRRARACLFLIPTALALLAFINDALTRATALIDQVTSGAVGLDPVALAAQLERQGDGSSLGSVSAGVMVVCWLLSIADAYLCARQAKPPV